MEKIRIYNGKDNFVYPNQIYKININLVTQEPVSASKFFFKFHNMVLQKVKGDEKIYRCEIEPLNPGEKNIILPENFSAGIYKNYEKDIIFLLYKKVIEIMISNNNLKEENLDKIELFWEIHLKNNSGGTKILRSF